MTTHMSPDNNDAASDQELEVERLLERIVDSEASMEDCARFELLADRESLLWRTLALRQQEMVVLATIMTRSAAMRTLRKKRCCCLSTSVHPAWRPWRTREPATARTDRWGHVRRRFRSPAHGADSLGFFNSAASSPRSRRPVSERPSGAVI